MLGGIACAGNYSCIFRSLMLLTFSRKTKTCQMIGALLVNVRVLKHLGVVWRFRNVGDLLHLFVG